MAARATQALGVVIALVTALAGTGMAQPAKSPVKAAPPKAAPPKKAPVEEVVERPVVGVINLNSPTDLDSKDLARAIADAIQAKPELAAVADSRVGAALVDRLDDEDDQAMEIAREKLAQARDQMAELDLVYAIRLAQDCREPLKDVMPTTAMTELLADIAFTEGQAHFALSQQDKSHLAAATTAFALVHQLAPGRTLDPNLYLEDLIDAFTQAAKPAKGTATLDIDAEGTIWIDGKEQQAGIKSVTVSPGRHLIVATGPEQQPSGAWRDVVDGQRPKIVLPRRTATSAVLAARQRKALAAAPDDAAARAGAMAAIARVAGLTAAVIVTTDKQGSIAVQLWRNKSPGFGAIKTAQQPWSSAAEKTIEPLVPPKKVVEPVGGPNDGTGGFGPFGNGGGKRDGPPKPWYRKRWVQVSLVAGVIGVIAGSIALSNVAGAGERTLGPFDELTGGLGRH